MYSASTVEQVLHASLIIIHSLSKHPPMFSLSSCRRMFPTIRVSFTGVKAEQRFLVVLDIVPADNKRYRYAYHRSSWLVAGKADPPAPTRLYVHPDCPYNGEQLKKQVVSFEKIKVTNNEMDKTGLVSGRSRTRERAAKFRQSLGSRI